MDNLNRQNLNMQNINRKNINMGNLGMENLGMEYSGMENPRMENPRMENPRMESPRMENPRMENPRMENPRMENPSNAMKGKMVMESPMLPKECTCEDMHRNELLKQLTALDFMAVDLHLYLDTHPCDKAALARYNCVVMQAEALREAYQSQYGPLYSFRSPSSYPWQWINNPWPWNYSFNFELAGEER